MEHIRTTKVSRFGLPLPGGAALRERGGRSAEERRHCRCCAGSCVAGRACSARQSLPRRCQLRAGVMLSFSSSFHFVAGTFSLGPLGRSVPLRGSRAPEGRAAGLPGSGSSRLRRFPAGRPGLGRFSAEPPPSRGPGRGKTPAGSPVRAAPRE